MKKAIAVAVAMAAATSANAAWMSGTQNTAGELLLTVWDPVAEVAFSQDLGILASDAIAGNIADGTTIQLDATGLAHVGTGNLQWNIAGADTQGAAYDPVSGRLNTGLYFTNSGIVPTTPRDYFGTIVGWVNTFFFNAEAIMAPGVGTNPTVLTSGDLAHAGELPVWGSDLAGLVPANPELSATAGPDGQPLEALTYTAIVTDPTTFAYKNVIESKGYWTLDSTVGTLTFTAVPVPAAAWLFGSALLGLVGFGRGRK